MIVNDNFYSHLSLSSSSLWNSGSLHVCSQNQAVYQSLMWPPRVREERSDHGGASSDGIPGGDDEQDTCRRICSGFEWLH